MGIEMLINAVLKATGFTREKMEHAFIICKSEFEAMKTRAIKAENAIEALQVSNNEILDEIKKLVNKE